MLYVAFRDAGIINPLTFDNIRRDPITRPDFLSHKEDLLYQASIYQSRPCSTCSIIRPPLSSHCKYCNTCVMNYDHHCTVLNQCIGARNLRAFTIWILLVFVSCVFLELLAFFNIIWIEVYRNETIGYYGSLDECGHHEEK